MSVMLSFSLPQWYDLHVHLRQDELLPITVQDAIKMNNVGVLAMPNTKRLTQVFEKDERPDAAVLSGIDLG